MPSDSSPDLEQLLKRMRDEASNTPVDRTLIWGLAAGELPASKAEQVAKATKQSREAMEEWAIATHLLDDRDAPAEVPDVEPVMARIQADKLARTRSRIRRVAGIATITFAAAAALVLWLALPPSSSAPVASFQVAGIERVTERNGDPTTALKFRVWVNCKRECHVLLLAVSSTDASVEAQLLHPRESASWVQDPFPLGVEISLPPPLDGRERLPFEIPNRGLVVLCTKTDGPFAAAMTADVIAQVKVAAENVSQRLVQGSPAEREALLRRIGEAIRTSGREGWEVSFQDVVTP